jgi:hypothetical protein
MAYRSARPYRSSKLYREVVAEVIPPPETRQALPVIVVVLRVGSTYSYFSDVEYGDNYTRWHDARVTGDIAFSRGGDCVLWGGKGGGGQSGLGNIELINNDGELDSLCTGSQEDAWVDVYDVYQDQPMSTAVHISAAVVSRIEGRGEKTARLVTGDIRERLDVPLQTSLYESGDGEDTLIGRGRPVSIGNPLSCPVILVDGVDYDYDVHDSDAHTVVIVRDKGYPLDVGTLPGDGYKISPDAGIFGIQLLQTPIGRVVADISATTFSAEVLVGSAEGDFATDIADWTTATTGSATVVWDGVGAAEMTADGTSAAARSELKFPTELTAGQSYTASAAVNLTTVTGPTGYAGIQIFFRPTSLAPADYVSIGTRTTAGTATLSATFVAPVAGHLVIECVASGGATVEALIDTVRLDRVAAGGNLTDVIQLLLARAGISSDRINSSSLTALDTARPWPVSYWADKGESVGSVLQKILDSVCGFMYLDNTGDITFDYLRPPEDADAVVLDITSTELAGAIESEPDLAPGLATTVAGSKNWYAYGEGELADAISDADRVLLTADYRIRKTTASAVSVELRNRSGEPMVTYLDSATDIQTQADYLADLYPVGTFRRFWDVPVLMLSSESIAALNPGDKVRVTYDRYGLNAGVEMRLVRIAGMAGESIVTLRCWA